MKKVEFTVGRIPSRVTAYLNEDLSAITESHASHPAIIIIPGGGYNHVSPREGDPVALRFLAHAVNTFILDYPVGDEIRKEKPLDTLCALVATIIERAEDFNVDRGRIALIGFSAGAHLAASYGTICKGKDVKAMILGYPVISSGESAHQGSFDNLCQNDEERDFYSLEKRVDSATLPSFIFHTADDATVPVENSLLFAKALAKAEVPFEMHIFPSGRHGSSLGTENVGTPNPVFASWFDMSLRWLFGIWDYRE